MKNVKKYLWIIVIIIVFAATGFAVGRYSEASRYQREKELDYRLNRSDLEGLGDIEGTIYVAGHKSPDSDAVGSAIAYAALLSQLGYDAQPVILGKINNETKYVLESGGIEVPMLLEDASGLNMVLVDHSEYLQSANGLKEANVISIIDHHADGSVTTSNQLIYDARPLGSAATIIWLRYKNYGLEVDQKTAYAMVGAILSDTNNLVSTTTTFADREALKALSLIAGIDDIDALYQGMHEASLSYEGMTDEEIYFSDYKEYEDGATKFGIGCVKAHDEESAKDMAKRMSQVLSSVQNSSDMDMLFVHISYYHDDISVNHLIGSTKEANEILKEAFGDALYDGTSYRLEPGVSRKQVMVPAITGVLESYGNE